jgi:hypothetical protein
MLRRILNSLILQPPQSDGVECIADFAIPANDAILRTSNRFSESYSYANSTKYRDGRRAFQRYLSGHPDCIDYFWHEAGVDLPDSARWVIRGAAAFAHPDTKLIFAMMGGPRWFRVRLPQALKDFAGLGHDETLLENDGSLGVLPSINVSEDRRLLREAFAGASP